MSLESASERQRSYARDLGISFSDDISMSEMSTLISKALRAKYPPPAWLERWATRLGVDSADRPSREVFARVEGTLAMPGNEVLMATYFVHQVHRHRNGRVWNDPNDSGLPEAQVGAIAEAMCSNPKVVASMRYHEANYAGGLHSFGQRDGGSVQLGSTKTLAYRTAAALLDQPPQQPPAADSPSHDPQPQDAPPSRPKAIATPPPTPPAATGLNGFSLTPLRKVGFFARLFRRRPRANAVVEIGNLLATTAIPDITEEVVSDVLRQYRIRPQDFRAEGCEVYATVLRHAVRDDALSDDEVADLRHLQGLLGLDDNDVRGAHEAVTRPIYEHHFAAAADDRELTEAEQTRLIDLATKLRMSDQLANAIRAESIGPLFQRVLDNATSDRRLSPDEDAQLSALARQLNVTLTHDNATAATLDRFRLLWRIENGELPLITPSIRLQRGEQCHATIPAVHHELRTRTRAVRYAGPTVRVPIMKGVAYRVGSATVNRVTEDVLHEIDQGTLYVTSKRLILDGSRKTTNIPYSKVINATRYDDGIVVEKDTGKDQVFRCDGDVEIFAVIFSAAMQRSA